MKSLQDPAVSTPASKPDVLLNNVGTLIHVLSLDASGQGMDQRLIKDGKMPMLNQVLDAIDEVRRNPAHVPMPDFDDDAETMLIRNPRGGS